MLWMLSEKSKNFDNKSEPNQSKPNATEIRISSNHRELHGAIFLPQDWHMARLETQQTLFSVLLQEQDATWCHSGSTRSMAGAPSPNNVQLHSM